MVNLKKIVQGHRELITETRRDLHRIPEPAFTERKTSAYIAEFLQREGLHVQRGIARFGVVGTLDTGRPGKTLLIRADMDALEVGTQVVSALQRITSRHMNPLKPAVVTVGSFHAGSTFNVIPGTAEMSGTLRTFDREIWLSWRERLDTIIRGVCDSMGATNELTYEQGYPPLGVELYCRYAFRLLAQ